MSVPLSRSWIFRSFSVQSAPSLRVRSKNACLTVMPFSELPVEHRLVDSRKLRKLPEELCDVFTFRRECVPVFFLLRFQTNTSDTIRDHLYKMPCTVCMTRLLLDASG